MLEKDWKEKMGDWNKQPRSKNSIQKSNGFILFINIIDKLPKWCGERPGKKSGDPQTPEDEETKDEEDIEDEELEDNDNIDQEEVEEAEEEEEYEEDEEGYEYEEEE